MANSGITTTSFTETLRNLEGELTVNGVAMGAYANEDVTFEVEMEYDDPQFAGTIGILENTEVIITATARLNIKLKQFAYAKLQVMLGDLGYDSSGTSEKIGGADLTFRKYVHDVVFTGIWRGNQSPDNVKITIARAVVNTGGLNFGAATTSADVTFESRVNPSNPRTLQAFIEFEKP